MWKNDNIIYYNVYLRIISGKLVINRQVPLFDFSQTWDLLAVEIFFIFFKVLKLSLVFPFNSISRVPPSGLSHAVIIKTALATHRVLPTSFRPTLSVMFTIFPALKNSISFEPSHARCAKSCGSFFDEWYSLKNSTNRQNFDSGYSHMLFSAYIPYESG